MGGRFGIDPQSAGPVFPGQAGIAGLVKTLALEWPAVRCKAIDLALTPAGRRAGTRSPRRTGRLRFRDRGRLCGESALGPETSAERLASGCHAHRAAQCRVGCSGHRRCARHHGPDCPRAGGAVPAHAGAPGTLSGAAGDREPRNRRHRGRGRAQADPLRALAAGRR